jgi:hypothetical protein
MAMFLELRSGDYVNISAAVYVKQYDDPALGKVFRLHFTEREIVTISDPDDLQKVENALQILRDCRGQSYAKLQLN